MGLEYVTQPPRLPGDVVISDHTMKTISNVGYHAEFSFDPFYVQIGRQDALTLINDLVTEPTIEVEPETIVSLLDKATEPLQSNVKNSYMRGVSLLLEDIAKGK